MVLTCNLCQAEKTGQTSEQFGSTRKPSQVRRPVKCVKRIKGKKGKPDTIDLLVQIDRVGTKLDGCAGIDNFPFSLSSR